MQPAGAGRRPARRGCATPGAEGRDRPAVRAAATRPTGNELIARAAGVDRDRPPRGRRSSSSRSSLTRVARAADHPVRRTMERRIAGRASRGPRRAATSTSSATGSRRFQRLHAITGVARGRGRRRRLVRRRPGRVFDVLGIPLQPVLAGAGLCRLVIGFGAQQLVRDVLAGIAMLIEDQYGVGDWIQIEDRIGQVERVGLRATSFRDLDGVLWHTLNGSIERVGNLSQEWSRSTLDVPLALDADVPTAKAIIHKVATELAADPVWGAGHHRRSPRSGASRSSAPTGSPSAWSPRPSRWPTGTSTARCASGCTTPSSRPDIRMPTPAGRRRRAAVAATRCCSRDARTTADPSPRPHDAARARPAGRRAARPAPSGRPRRGHG